MTEMTQRAAAEWFALQRAGQMNERERAEFSAWLRASPANMREYLAIASVAHDLRLTPKLTAAELRQLMERARTDAAETVVPWRADTTGADSQAQSHPVPATQRGLRSGTRAALLAASFVIALTVAYGVWRSPDLNPLWHHYRTGHGEQQTIQLADGSVMHLNSSSSAIVRFTSNERLIEMQAGQALFNVVHEPKRRFRVRVGTTDVIAVGTEFDVYERTSETVVTVVNGVVAVYDERKESLPPATLATSLDASPNPGAARLGLRVAAGQQVKLARRPVALPAPMAIDVHKATAWLQREIVFDEEPLAEVVVEFNRYGQVPIEIADARLAALRISGVFNAYDGESFLQFLAKLRSVEVHATTDRILIEARVPAPSGEPHL
jgi:transmembrane sensor